MTARRIIAIVGVFILACAGWAVLGTTTLLRTDHLSHRLGGEVESLWGSPLLQKAPAFTVTIPGTEQSRHLIPSASRVTAALRTDYRQRGLIWHPTYVVDFEGAWSVTNGEAVAQKVQVRFAFPSPGATYDRFRVRIDGRDVDIPVNTESGVQELIEAAPGQTREFRVAYQTRGMEEWRYRPAPVTGRVRNLGLSVTANFEDVDFPEGTLSPMNKIATPGGMTLDWKAEDLITTQDVGLLIPERLNPGPVCSRITFFAPVCLFFFFILMVTIQIVRSVPIHPMHYLFVAAGFVAFHLLFAYLVDHVNVHAAFAASAVVSVGLVTAYLAGALGSGFPWRIAAAGQVFYLVVFSYTFFMEGLTGLMVAVCSVLTLAILMKVTARTKWEEVFA